MPSCSPDAAGEFSLLARSRRMSAASARPGVPCLAGWAACVVVLVRLGAGVVAGTAWDRGRPLAFFSPLLRFSSSLSASSMRASSSSRFFSCCSLLAAARLGRFVRPSASASASASAAGAISFSFSASFSAADSGDASLMFWRVGDGDEGLGGPLRDTSEYSVLGLPCLTPCFLVPTSLENTLLSPRTIWYISGLSVYPCLALTAAMISSL
mmetsp:Transcript_6217/g.24003  ORF Transcript_6217/g.24003 Transcript_6217/m.24003 type:complete len:211 (-) Transcript_6217:499-1131(-)